VATGREQEQGATHACTRRPGHITLPVHCLPTSIVRAILGVEIVKATDMHI
jgi:hypothetical protein